ncbi:protein strawberry notch-like isoform X1 [Odontomachus brunneus]|uniref:protein strawberry notch-like isoform X1 n=1 Tax=Odontomachus brunneus TaxID=486640 RepID=UPI0013F1E098|nr:protein strawberry notch-like isoform X1 [Odontomachus brunneus]XP_032679499.1 protein strawberry notch-like isoform X2 [Odontomachus brunneus]XP_032679500.1 protein strawberry notch-like isoform X3 [Odontomachus brunneus]XP_032679501.1 protein strawberry notch-like isoform X1 [Odontomachus brunneus]XP_032679502.1 protein strawberry notch-like isoform X1 [Odontomachus brunneus]
MATKKYDDGISDDTSGSDFDDEEDPDKIEVPGGGKDLATAAGIANIKDEKPDLSASPLAKTQGALNALNQKFGNKIPGGLVTKPAGLGYEMGHVGGSQGVPPGFVGMNQLNQLSQLASGYGFPPGLATLAGFNPAAFLQPSMDMNALMGSFMGMPGMNMGVNPFVQFLNQSGIGGPNWSGLSGKAVSQMWMNSGDPTKLMQPPIPEEEEVDDEDMGVAETYADYMPMKLKLGRKHPDPVVETASLSSVEPTDVWYKLSMSEETIRSGVLSALQLESITYASQQHEHLLPDGSRAGFLIGDGAGVGKGRTIAGIIFENYLKSRKRAIWVSVSNDLKYDAERDLKDIGASRIEVHALNKFKYAKISSAVNGNVKKGVIFSTYSALIGESSQSGGKYKSRLKQLLQWCGEDFDGLIIFDECHRAKNLCPTGSSKPTKTGLTVLELQNKLPKARVVYASATGASEPRNMAYMVRLGMWGEGTPFPEFNDFITAVEKRGVGAMEIVAMDMKLRGMYIARQLSFHGVAFKIEEVPLSKDFTKIYDHSVRLWVEAMQRFQEAAELIDAENRMKKTMWGQFWSAHQRFFKYLCIAAKVKHAVLVAREAVKCGKCVVIGLQSTGEARTLEQLERDDGELTDFVSTAKGVLQTLVEKHFPAPDRSRIQRLLGLEPSKFRLEDDDMDGASGSAGGSKRKPVRQAAQRASKKVRTWSSEEEITDEERNGAHSSGSEFKLSGSESEDDHHTDEESNISSDFNPFFSDSDSDVDPWDRRKKKGNKKQKKPAKKRLSTQDKIQSMLVHKSSTNKNKRNGDTALSGHMGIVGNINQAPPRDAIERACSMKEELLAKIEALGERLPPNTLDQLIDELGGPENVAEMTGRKGRVVQTEDGAIQYESRSEVDVPLETLNLTEKQRFMDGEKTVAIISEAASSGISLQSDRRARNQMRRVHITLELPWSADRAIQQFGRTHRSNQVNAPEYIFLISDLAGERRFASIVAKRLESLGALTHGDRRATETRDLSQFNIDNKYGRTALEATMKAIMGFEAPLVPPPQDYHGEFFKDVAAALVGVGLICNSENTPGILALDKDYNNMSKFLNRILGMPVDLQNRLFKYFTDTLNAIITQAKKTGRFDMGILDLGTSGENVRRVRLYRFLRKHATGKAPTELHVVHVERGMSWSEATDKFSELTGSKEGFYLSHQIRNGKQTAILAVIVDSGKKKSESKKDQLYMVYRPNTGLQLRQETLGELEKKYKKMSANEAEPHWSQQYEASVNTCSHAYWSGNCKNTNLGIDCEVGLRRRSYNVLAGSVLSVWSRVESILASRSGHNSKMQVVRLRTDEGLKIVGTLIPKSCMEVLHQALSSDSEKTEELTF